MTSQPFYNRRRFLQMVGSGLMLPHFLAGCGKEGASADSGDPILTETDIVSEEALEPIVPAMWIDVNSLQVPLDYDASLAEITTSVLNQIPTESTGAATYARLVEDAVFYDRLFTYGKWGAVIVGSAAIMALAPVACPMIGKLIVGTLSLRGPAVISAGLAWLGGGGLASSGFGAGGSYLISTIVEAGTALAIEQGVSALEKSDHFEEPRELMLSGSRTASWGNYWTALTMVSARMGKSDDPGDRVLTAHQFGVMLLDLAHQMHPYSSEREALLTHAERLFSQMNRTEVKSGLPSFYLGVIAQMRAQKSFDYSDAVMYFRESISREPSNPEPYFELCRIMRWDGLATDAAQEVSTFLAHPSAKKNIHMSRRKAMELLGGCYIEQGSINWEAAYEAYERAYQVEPSYTNLQAMIDIGHQFLKDKKGDTKRIASTLRMQGSELLSFLESQDDLNANRSEVLPLWVSATQGSGNLLQQHTSKYNQLFQAAILAREGLYDDHIDQAAKRWNAYMERVGRVNFDPKIANSFCAAVDGYNQSNSPWPDIELSGM